MPSYEYTSRLFVYLLLNVVRTFTILGLLAGAASEMALLVFNLREKVANHILDDIFYVGTPGIPRTLGGAAGFGLYHSLSFLVLLTAAISEMPMPKAFSKRMQSFWERMFTPFSEEEGCGVAGFFMLLLGSLRLSQNTPFKFQLAGWILVGLGGANLILGLILGVSVNYFRSDDYLSDIDEESELPALPLPVTASIGSSTKSSRLSDSINSAVVCHVDPEKWISMAVPSFIRRMSGASGSLYSSGGSSRGPISSPRSIPSNSEWNDDDRSRLGPMVQIRR
ncbi:hypothetical protein RQP46_003458 [Phenoliferia psychrophenolica]